MKRRSPGKERSTQRWALHFEARLQHYRRVATGHLFTVRSTRVGKVHDQIELLCPFNHAFELTGKDLQRGVGCPSCRLAAQEGFRKRQLEDANRIARARGGLCLATEFINARSVLAWRCHKGHVWEATLDNVRRGHWCRHCARKLPRPGRRRKL